MRLGTFDMKRHKPVHVVVVDKRMGIARPACANGREFLECIIVLGVDVDDRVDPGLVSMALNRSDDAIYVVPIDAMSGNSSTPS